MFTVALSENEAGVYPESAVHDKVNTVRWAIVPDSLPDDPDDDAVHTSPVLPVTVHESTFATFQYTRTVPPARTIDGSICRCPVYPVVDVNEGAGGMTQAPLEHWYEHVCEKELTHIF